MDRQDLVLQQMLKRAKVAFKPRSDIDPNTGSVSKF